jgi:DNA-binding NtrC family response regulator
MSIEGSNRSRILLVDDDGLVLEALSRGLSERFDVTTAQGGIAGLAAAVEGFDAIVTDVDMPDLDGVALKGRLDAAGLSTPTIMMSADPSRLFQAMGAGARAFIEKPFTLPEIEQEILWVLADEAIATDCEDWLTGSYASRLASAEW